MKYSVRYALMLLSAASVITSCAKAPASQAAAAEGGQLVGAWRSKITFQNGALAGMKNLEFLLAYSAGGTMTESSNYDEAANSSPPAYGVWKEIDAHTFETKYLFFTTKAPSSADTAAHGRDWWPDGHGVLTETITLSADGQSYASTIALVLHDSAGAPIAGGGSGTGAGTRIAF